MVEKLRLDVKDKLERVIGNSQEDILKIRNDSSNGEFRNGKICSRLSIMGSSK